MKWATSTYQRSASPDQWITRLKFEQSQYRDDEPFVFDGTLFEVLGSLTAILNDIPEEHRATAACEFNASTSYDSSMVTIEVSYRRPATPDEITAANDARGQSEHAAQQREIEQLRALKAKYPDVN